MNELKLIVRTPQKVVVETFATSVRVLTETGHVGLRPKMEAVVLAVETGLVLVYQSDAILFVGTTGGLLMCDGQMLTLLTPLAVAATNEEAVVNDLQRELDHPQSELEVRKAISSIQSRIVNELREDRRRRDKRSEGGP
jgi:F0F1-type ATP synthase epsilon subunit